MLSLMAVNSIIITGGNIIFTMKHINNYLQKVDYFTDSARKFLLFITLNFINLGAIQVILGLYILKLGYNEKFFGIVVAARILATGIMAIPAGLLNKKIRAKNVLLLSALLAGISLLLQVFFVDSFMLLVLNFIYGTAYAVIFVNIAPFLSHNSSSKERKELFSLNFVLMTIARMIGSFLAGYLPGLFLQTFLNTGTNLIAFKYVLIILSAFSLFSIIPVLYMKNSSTSNNTEKENFSLKKGFQKEKLGKLSIYQFLLGAGGGLIAPFFSIFLSQKLGASPGQIGTIMFFYRFLMAIALLITPYLISKIGKVKSVGFAQISSLPFLLAIVLIPNFAIVCLTFLIRGALMSMTRPIASDFAMEITSSKRKTMTSSIMRTSKSVARSASATTAGWIITNYGFKLTYILTFVFYLTGAFLFLKSFLKVERKRA